MENNHNGMGKSPGNRLIATAIKEGIPPGRYVEIVKRQDQSLIDRTEARKALEFIVESNFEKDTLSITLDIFIDKIIKAVKDHVTAELMAENWRVS